MKKALVCALLALTGCSELDRLKDMQNTTNSMNDKMSTVTGNTGQVNTATDHLYENLRQGNSMQTRQDQLRAMETATTQEEKIRAASVYMMAFEFQLWTGDGLDDEAKRESLFNDLFNELDFDFRAYIHTDQLSLDPTLKTNDMMNLYAMAATLHMINPLQTTLVSNDPSIQSYSVLTLMEKALTDNKTMPQSQLATWEITALGTNATDLSYVIQLRANFVPMLVLSNFANLEYASFLGQAKDLATSFPAKLSDIGSVELTTDTSYLVDMDTERGFLKSIGLTPEYNCLLNVLYKNMTLPEVTKTTSDVTVGTVSAIDGFKAGLPQLSSTESDECMGSKVLSKLNPINWF